jgi:hypothetical protein
LTDVPLPPTDASTKTPVPPTATPTPRPTQTPTSIPSPTATVDADPTVYDNFNNPAFDGRWNTGLWYRSSDGDSTLIEQRDGFLTISRQLPKNAGLNSSRNGTIDEIAFVEAKIKLDSNIQTPEGGTIGIGIQGYVDGDWSLNCSIFGRQQDVAGWASCDTSEGYYESSPNGFKVAYDSWHSVRIEMNPDTAEITFYVDDQPIGSTVPANPEEFKNAPFQVKLRAWSADGGLVTGYIDDIRIGPAEQ